MVCLGNIRVNTLYKGDKDDDDDDDNNNNNNTEESLNTGSWARSVSMAIGLDCAGFESRQMQDIFLFCRTFSLTLGLT